jgi:hypothetical protein
MPSNWCRSLLLACAASLAFAATATAAAPPAPTAVNGHPVTVVARGIAPGTSFALDPTTGTIFVGAYGDPEHHNRGGGVFALAAAGGSEQVPGIPGGVAGLVFSNGTLYVAANAGNAGKIIAYSGWNGTAFASSKTIFNARTTVGSVNGIALGPDGRIYGGGGLVHDVNRKGTVRKFRFPHNPYSVYSIKTDGTGFRIVARGLRQPWQMTFVAGKPNPFVSNLSQETGKVPLDGIVVAKRHSNFGFPKCFAHVGINCRRHYSQPLIKLPRHSSPMGIQAVGNQLFVVLFNGIGKSGPEVVTMPAKRGAKPKPFVKGFGAPIVGLGIIGGQMYIGDVMGNVWRVAL